MLREYHSASETYNKCDAAIGGRIISLLISSEINLLAFHMWTPLGAGGAVHWSSTDSNAHACGRENCQRSTGKWCYIRAVGCCKWGSLLEVSDGGAAEPSPHSRTFKLFFSRAGVRDFLIFPTCNFRTEMMSKCYTRSHKKVGFSEREGNKKRSRSKKGGEGNISWIPLFYSGSQRRKSFPDASAQWWN